MEAQQISQEQGQESGFGGHPVSVIPNFYITLSDGVKLSAKIWFPDGDCCSQIEFGQTTAYPLYNPAIRCEGEKSYPTLLEYLPYRWTDFTSHRDYQRHPWFCSHGYVCIRVDMRGSGNSEGLYHDEYTATELQDGCEVIAWIAKQVWSNGRVGMYGKSWGGFNGLQVAYQQPPALKAIISLYSTDDRYASDVHYMGGCIIGSEMLAWACRMFVWNVSPPHPGYVPDWKARWLERLDKASSPWVTKWLGHQTRDAYWQHGSVCEDFTKVKCPVLAIGGWCDSYHDAVFRIVEGLPNARGIVGPWSHDWPDCSAPGPRIAYLEECLKWWDCHLKRVKNGAMDTPRLRLYMRDALEPAIHVDHWPGRWVAMNKWPIELADHPHKVTFIPAESIHGNILVTQGATSVKGNATHAYINFVSEHGSRAGSWCCFGCKDLPADQRVEDGLSTNWTCGPLSEDLAILGFPVLNCTFSTEATSGVLASRLCHVWPDGKSTLITYGLANLCHRKGHSPSEAAPLVPRTEYAIKLKFHSASYTVPKGHKLRMSLSTNFWPRLWPASHNCPLKVHLSSDGNIKTSLDLPVLDKSSKICEAHAAESGLQNFLKEPTCRPSLLTTDDIPGSVRRASSFDHISGESQLSWFVDSGEQLIQNTLARMRNVNEECYTICQNDPLSAKVKITRRLKLEYPASNVKTRVQTYSEMSADKSHFFLVNTMQAYDGDTLVAEKSWNHKMDRDLV